jgi:putative addiction module component (TIGR02574 family)
MTKEEIVSQAMELTPCERQALGEELLFSIIGTGQEEIDQAWLEEARRRDADLNGGRTKTSALEDVIQRVLTGRP